MKKENSLSLVSAASCYLTAIYFALCAAGSTEDTIQWGVYKIYTAIFFVGGMTIKSIWIKEDGSQS